MALLLLTLPFTTMNTKAPSDYVACPRPPSCHRRCLSASPICLLFLASYLFSKCRCPNFKAFPLRCSILSNLMCSKKNSAIIYASPRASSVLYSLNSGCHRILSTHLRKYQFHSFLSIITTTPRNIFERQSFRITSRISAAVTWNRNDWEEISTV